LFLTHLAHRRNTLARRIRALPNEIGYSFGEVLIAENFEVCRGHTTVTVMDFLTSTVHCIMNCTGYTYVGLHLYCC
jgi:hypothetical protein